MSEFVKIAPNGQWDLLTKNEGTGVVQAPKDLSRVHDAPITAPMPKITPQPAERVGLAAKPAITDTKPTTDPTALRPQTGTQLYTMSNNTRTPVSPAERIALPPGSSKTIVSNPTYDVNRLHDFGVHPDPFNAALAEDARVMRERSHVAPAVPPVNKMEPGDDPNRWNIKTHDIKGRCYHCGSKSCDGEDCKIDHEKIAVDANNKTNKGFKNTIKGVEKLSLNKGGQWSLSLEKAIKPPRPTAPYPDQPGYKAWEARHGPAPTPPSMPAGSATATRAKPPPPRPPPVVKTEEDGRNDKAECEKCHAKRCQCNKTGILLDKAVNVSTASPVGRVSGTPDDSI